MLRILLFLLIAAGSLSAQEPQARGTHTLSDGAGGSIVEEWELVRTADGTLQVNVRAGSSAAAEKLPLMLGLDEQLRLTSFRVEDGRAGVRLSDSGYELIHGDSAGNTGGEKKPLERPFTLISSMVWALPRIVLAAAGAAEPMPVVLLVPDNPGARIQEQAGTIRFIASEEITIRSTPIIAERYELRSESLNVDIWATDEGFVLAYQDANRPEQRAELTKFERLGELLPSLGSLSK